MKRTLKTLLVLLAALSLLCGCAKVPAAVEVEPVLPEPTEAAAATPEPALTLTDMLGRTVTLSGPAERVVVLSAGDAEILYAIGACATLVGRGEYCNYPAEILDVPAVSSGAETNLEQIIALDPDAVVMTKMAQTEEQVNQLEAAGIPVLVTDAQDVEGVYADVALLSALTGRDGAGAALVESLRAGFAEIGQAASGKTVYFEVSPLEWGLWTAGANTFMDEIAAMLGLTNAFSDVDGWAEVSEEQVLARNPDYIVTVAMYYGEGPTPVEEICARAGWQGVAAVQNAAVFNADSDAFSRPGPRLLQAAQALYEFVYGEAAADVAA